MKTRHLQFALQPQVRYGRVADIQKIVVFDEVTQHPGVYQQRGLAFARIGGLQIHQLRAKSSSNAAALRCPLTRQRTRPARYTLSANGHRFRPITALSNQRRVAAIISSVSMSNPPLRRTV